MDRLKSELARAQKSNSENSDRADKLKKQNDLLDSRLQELKKLNESSQAEVKELRSKLRVSEHERNQLASKQGDLGETKKALQPSVPSLRVFLLRRNEDRGWRRGQDWSRQDWKNVLKALEEIGQKFEDSLVLLSLAELNPHVTEIFATPMRPTGQ